MVSAKDFDHDVITATQDHQINDLFEFGKFFSHLHQLATIGADADHRHLAYTSHQRIGDRDHLEKSQLNESVLSLADHTWRHFELLGDLGKCLPTVFLQRLDDIQIN